MVVPPKDLPQQEAPPIDKVVDGRSPTVGGLLASTTPGGEDVVSLSMEGTCTALHCTALHFTAIRETLGLASQGTLSLASIA